MITPLHENLAEQVTAATAASPGQRPTIAEIVGGRHLADVAVALRELDPDTALAVFEHLDGSQAAEVLDELDPGLTRYLIDHAPPGRIADLLDRLPMDDAAEVVSEATLGRAKQLLADLPARPRGCGGGPRTARLSRGERRAADDG